MKKIIVFILLISLHNLSYAVDFGSFSCRQIINFERDNNKAQMYAISLWFGVILKEGTWKQVKTSSY